MLSQPVRQFCCLKQHCCIEEHFVINWISSRTSTIEQTCSMRGANKSTIEHYSSMEADRWSELPVNSSIRHQEARPSQLSNIPVRHQPSSPNSTSMPLLWSFWSTCLRRRQIRRRRFQRNNLTYALYVATRLWHLPLIGNICYHFIRWMWSGLLWCTTTTSTRTREPNSTDN